MKFGAFFMADFIETILIAALIATLFFRGWQVPYLQSDGFHMPWGSFHALPRFRYDQLMRLGWKYMLPISILNIFVTALVLLII